MSIILLIFMSDIFFCICLMRDVLLLLSTILFYDLNNPYLMRGCEKGSHKYRGTRKCKTPIFNLRSLSHFCMDIYATKKSISAVKRPF